MRNFPSRLTKFSELSLSRQLLPPTILASKNLLSQADSSHWRGMPRDGRCSDGISFLCNRKLSLVRSCTGRHLWLCHYVQQLSTHALTPQSGIPDGTAHERHRILLFTLSLSALSFYEVPASRYRGADSDHPIKLHCAGAQSTAIECANIPRLSSSQPINQKDER